MKLKGNPILWMYAVAALLWFGSSSGRSLTLEDNNTFLKQYRTVHFTTDGATAESYRQFIEELRNSLGAEIPDDNRTHGIPMLRSRSQVPVNSSHRFVIVQLTNSARQSIEIGVDVTDLYLVGYRVGNDAYIFRDVQVGNLFNDSTRNSLDLPLNYDQLGRIAGTTRERQFLGRDRLDVAIGDLYRYPTSDNLPDVARSFIICAQMISEAARFRYIEIEMRRRIRHGDSAPSGTIISLENNWNAISTAIESSNGGAFGRSVLLAHPTGGGVNADNVRDVINYMGILLYACTPRSSSRFSSLIRQVVPNLNDDVCVDYEPTMRITGLNGLCVEVAKDRYEDGNPVELWTCKSNSARNQLWTLKKDGTIRSNDKCLTACSDIPRSYLMIFNCVKAAVDASHWQVLDDGTIINPKSGLVLSATSAKEGITLTVETNIHATNQGWLPSNNTQPFVTSIVGLNDLCLTYTDLHYYEYCDKYSGNVLIEECANKKDEQQWAIYADGSIRTKKKLDYCLTGDANVEGGIVRILPCRLGFTGQRWVFKGDGTIWNLYYGLVLEVKDSNPNLKKLIISPFTGKPNQIWIKLL